MKPAQLTQTISDTLDSLRKSERKVAELILQDPSQMLPMRIADLAAAVGVSEPTVIRFCRALGFDGFQSFKLQLAQYLGSSGNYVQFSVSAQDSVADVNRSFAANLGVNHIKQHYCRSDLDATRS